MQIMIEKLEQYFRESKIQVKATYKIRWQNQSIRLHLGKWVNQENMR
jgi:hypothetical protein